MARSARTRYALRTISTLLERVTKATPPRISFPRNDRGHRAGASALHGRSSTVTAAGDAVHSSGMGRSTSAGATARTLAIRSDSDTTAWRSGSASPPAHYRSASAHGATADLRKRRSHSTPLLMPQWDPPFSEFGKCTRTLNTLEISVSNLPTPHTYASL